MGALNHKTALRPQKECEVGKCGCSTRGSQGTLQMLIKHWGDSAATMESNTGDQSHSLYLWQQNHSKLKNIYIYVETMIRAFGNILPF